MREPKPRLYNIWSNMKQRCLNQARKDYPLYGGRGITVCQEWQSSYRNFKAWALAHGYRDDLTLDRIDTDGPYCPGNCQWATWKAQANNRRNNRLITLNGRTQSMKQWAEEIGIGNDTLWRRLEKGWPVERALTAPVDIKKRKRGARRAGSFQ